MLRIIKESEKYTNLRKPVSKIPNFDALLHLQVILDCIQDRVKPLPCPYHLVTNNTLRHGHDAHTVPRLRTPRKVFAGATTVGQRPRKGTQWKKQDEAGDNNKVHRAKPIQASLSGCRLNPRWRLSRQWRASYIWLWCPLESIRGQKETPTASLASILVKKIELQESTGSKISLVNMYMFLWGTWWFLSEVQNIVQVRIIAARKTDQLH